MPKPFSTTAEPASASARAIPSPMPLVDPVTSDTLLARDRETEGAPCVSTERSWQILLCPSCDEFGALRSLYPLPNSASRPGFTEMPISFRNDRLALLRY